MHCMTKAACKANNSLKDKNDKSIKLKQTSEEHEGLY